jgi:hypothetical protein
MSIFDGLMRGNLTTGLHSLFGFEICSWYVERRPLPLDSNMFWISPANIATFNNLLGYLGSGDIESILRCIGSVSGPEVKSLVIFNLNFGCCPIAIVNIFTLTTVRIWPEMCGQL